MYMRGLHTYTLPPAATLDSAETRLEPIGMTPSSPTHMSAIKGRGCWETGRPRKLSGLKTVVLVAVGGCVLFNIVWVSLRAGTAAEPSPRWHQIASANFSQILIEQLNYGMHLDRSYASEEFSPRLYNLRRHTNPSHERVNCKAMFDGDRAEMTRAKEYTRAHPRTPYQEADYINMTANCDNFRRTRGYITRPLSREEYEFPIAFSLLVFSDIEQIERLLRAIYMPQNYYCIHIDTKAQEVVHNAIRSIARCFPNVFVASRLESVYWGHISIIYAEMNCLRDLLNYKWKYFINLSGQMFPLQTNRELVNILTLYDGANDIEGTYKRSVQFPLWMRQYFHWSLWETLGQMLPRPALKDAAPHGVTIYKGSNQVAISRAFAVYVLYSQKATDLLSWFEDTWVPDEYIWPTLNHNQLLHAPGAYRGDPETKSYAARGSVWQADALQINWSWKKWDCQGIWVRKLCVFGVGDLPWMYRRPEMFANKFHQDFEPVAYDCLEELIFNRTMMGDELNFDPTYYEHMDIVKNKHLVVTANESLFEAS